MLPADTRSKCFDFVLHHRDRDGFVPWRVGSNMADTSVQQMCSQSMGILCQPIDTTMFRNMRQVNYRPSCFSCVAFLRLVMRHYFIAAWKSGQVNTFYYLDFYVVGRVAQSV